MTTDFGAPYHDTVATNSYDWGLVVAALGLMAFVLVVLAVVWGVVNLCLRRGVLYRGWLWLRGGFLSTLKELKAIFASREREGKAVEPRKVFELTQEDILDAPLPVLRTAYEDFRNHDVYGELIFRGLLERSPDLFERWFDEEVSDGHGELLLIYRLERLPKEEAMTCVMEWVEKVEDRRLQPVIFLKRVLTRSHALWEEERFLERVHHILNGIMEDNVDGFQHLISWGELSDESEEVLLEYAFALCQRSAGTGLSLKMRMDLFKSHPVESFSREFFDQLMRTVPFPESLDVVERGRAIVPDLTELSGLEATANSSFLLRELVDDDALYEEAVDYFLSHMHLARVDTGGEGKQLDTIASGLFRARQRNHKSSSYMSSRQRLLDGYVKLAMDLPDRARQTLQILRLVEDRTSNEEEKELFRQARERLISALHLEMHRGTVMLIEGDDQQVGGLTEVEEHEQVVGSCF